MKSILRKEKDFSVSNWSGGKTKELAIFPADSKYADREFIYRLSSATVDLDESDFTMLPDYDRVLMVLQGSTVLTYNGKKTVHLDELEQDSFDGAWETKSYGRITDFNLMTRKGCAGKVDVIRPEAEAAEVGDTLESGLKRRTHAIYCKEGYIIVNAADGQKMVSQGQLLVMEFGEEEPAYTVMGNGVAIRSQIAFDEGAPGYAEYEELKPEREPEPEPEPEEEREREPEPARREETKKENAETPGSYVANILGTARRKVSDEGLSEASILDYKGGFAEDYKWAFILSNTQFHGAKALFPKLKSLVFDDELHGKVRRLEKMLITFFVFILGLLGLLTFSMKDGEMKDMEILIMIAVWLVIDILIVSPAIYYFTLPKPIKSHIHDLNKVSEAEAEALLNDRNKNERLERILKKYSNSGRNVGTAIADKARREKELDE
ncbi:MAG: HutD family protein [Firmicutes bacterium]|nr:HutD family protein [Bacillota bacterium]